MCGQRVPELPKEKRARFVQQYEVSPYDAGVLANDLDWPLTLKGGERRKKTKECRELDSERSAERSRRRARRSTNVRFLLKRSTNWST